MNDKIRDLASLIQALNEATKKFNTFDVWWRGQHLAEWKLVPSVHRNELEHSYEKISW